MLQPDEIARVARDALVREDGDRAAAQEVHGVDSLSEVELHGVLSKGFHSAGWRVWPERLYPSTPPNKRKKSDRSRCDLVVSDEDRELIDPVAEEILKEVAEDTLFARAFGENPQTTDPETPGEGGVGTSDVVWVEVKTTGRYCLRDGVAVANSSCGIELVHGPRADALKLASDERIEHGCVLLVIFAEDEEIARTLLSETVHRLLDAGTPVDWPAIEVAPITERMGNGALGVLTMRVHKPW